MNRLSLAAWMLMLLFCLGACTPSANSTTSQVAIQGASRMQQATIEQLFNQTTIPAVDNTLALFCSFNEGISCFFIEATQVEAFNFMYDEQLYNPINKLDGQLAQQILKDLDPKRVDQSKNNTVLLRCSKTNGFTCEINSGTAWEPLAIE
ncbi:hypothetical protein [Herpetosiphon sp. NSE202]|uniref:hypothetical protein n=1 Tax=Herpetosiphon sp. NSE202 TaxID=3351349 RepID=UPI003625694E